MRLAAAASVGMDDASVVAESEIGLCLRLNWDQEIPCEDFASLVAVDVVLIAEPQQLQLGGSFEAGSWVGFVHSVQIV